MDYRDAILAAVGSGIVTILVWMGPTVKRSIDAHPSALEAMSKISTSLASVAMILKAMQRAMRRRVDVLLVIEDQPFHATFLEELCREVVAKHHLTLVVTTSLHDAEEFLLSARLVILDVGLPDSDLADAQSFVENVVPPVIVLSITEYSDDTFPHAAKVVKKWSNSDEMVATVESVLASTYPKGRPLK